MKNIFRLVAVATAFFAITASANAGLVDFAEYASGNEHAANDGSTETIGGFNIEFSADKSGAEGYAYFDSSANTANDHAGLGVCGTLNQNGQCTPSSDDNITLTESVTLTFDFLVDISGLFFGDTDHHDVNGSDTLMINGDEYTFAAASAATFVGQTFTFAYNDNGNSPNQFYISAMNVERHVDVPAPAAFGLIFAGAAGIGAMRRRRNA